MTGDNEDQPWASQLLVTFGVMLVVALIVGAILGIIALAGSNAVGMGSVVAGDTGAPSLYFPTGSPTTKLEESPGPILTSASPSTGTTAPPPSSTQPAQVRSISLQAYPAHVRPGERINLSGTYPGHEGATLQIQRLEAGVWRDFPVDTHVSGGLFATYIITSRTGMTKLRMLDKANGAKSNTASVNIG
jgi:hypothetical protein